MKKTKLIATFLLLLFFVTSNAFSQGDFSFHFGLSFPMSDFADGNIQDEEAGCAGVGFGFGLQYVHPFANSGLGVFLGGYYNYNGLKKEAKVDIEDELPDNADITFHKYFNIPISAGLNYTSQSDEGVSFIGNIGLTYNFLTITDMVIKINNEDITAKFDLAKNMGFIIGGGILINKKTSIEINYLGLGKHEIEGKITYYKRLLNSTHLENLQIEQKVTILTLTIGFKL